jgi:hypothetical protein
MAQITDNDLQQLKDLINSSQAKTQQHFAELSQRIEVGFARTDERLKAVETQIKSVDTQMSDLWSRLNQQNIWFFTFLLMLLGTITTVVAKLAKLY